MSELDETSHPKDVPYLMSQHLTSTAPEGYKLRDHTGLKPVQQRRDSEEKE